MDEFNKLREPTAAEVIVTGCTSLINDGAIIT